VGDRRKRVLTVPARHAINSPGSHLPTPRCRSANPNSAITRLGRARAGGGLCAGRRPDSTL